MNELVLDKHSKAMTTSLIIAEVFGKNHKDVLKAIREKEHLFNERNFTPAKYTDAKGEKRPMYYLDRDFTTFLVMGFTGKKADEWKLKYIKAFNDMESLLKEKSSQEWLTARSNGKNIRKTETDVIQKLVEYAKEQGSTHSDMLYTVYSKLANKTADITDRNKANTYQLGTLSIIEHIIECEITNGMNNNLDYKEIYKNCKDKTSQFKDISYLDVEFGNKAIG